MLRRHAVGRHLTHAGIDPDGPELRKTIDTLVAHHVAVTSTLAFFAN